MWTEKCRLKFRYNKKKTFKQFYNSTHYYPVYIFLNVIFFLNCREICKFWIRNITIVSGKARNFIQRVKLNITKFSKVKNYDNRITQYKYQITNHHAS